MKYDFNEIVDRRNTNSLKWDIAEGELPMWVADMDLRTAPEITEAIIKRAEHGVFGYSVVPDEWYEAYIGWWKSRHGIEYKKDELIFSTGVIPIISSCVRKLTTAGENVLIMTPVYNIFFNCIKNNGRNVVEFALEHDNGEYSINWEKLNTALSDPQTSLMLLCNPHNPIGKIWDKETLVKIGELAYKNGVTVISDEIHCDITDPGCEYVPFALASEKCRDNCVVCIAPTKAFNLAGLQTAAAVVPNARLRHKVWRALNTDEVAEPNAFAVNAAIAAFTKGGEWLDELRQYIYENKMVVKGFLEKEIPRIRLVPSQATYLLWLDCSQLKMDSKALAEHIRKQTGLYLSNGVQFGNGENFLRMNIACPRQIVVEGLERLKRAVESL
ncbi:MAG: pyridoxal phosphate-dependent aminotransferase [Oscillospiraceae bacterium]|nr:pyridoxal phosphate-dependent aminotransferase [Oscillospiraceae bacterium]